MQAVVPIMRSQGRGSIINMSSTAEMAGYTDCFAHVAPKWAVRGMTNAAALELAAHGIRVNSVHPGDTATAMIAGASDHSGAISTSAEIPLGRYAQPDDVALLVLFWPPTSRLTTPGAEHVIDGAVLAETWAG